MKAKSTGFQPEWVHLVSFGLSTFLVGLNTSAQLPVGIANATLQIGIVGAIAAIGFGHTAAKRRARLAQAQATTLVEQRLDEHSRNVDRIDALVDAESLQSNSHSQRDQPVCC